MSPRENFKYFLLTSQDAAPDFFSLVAQLYAVLEVKLVGRFGQIHFKHTRRRLNAGRRPERVANLKFSCGKRVGRVTPCVVP